MRHTLFLSLFDVSLIMAGVRLSNLCIDSWDETEFAGFSVKVAV